jgi:hypothetical protein
MRYEKALTFFQTAVLALGALLLITLGAGAQNATPSATLPRMEGETLSSKKIILPDDARGKIALLSIGFSKKGGDTSRAWGDRFKKDFSADPRYALYPVAVLEDVPRFVRGMILGGMRRGVPAQEQDRFVTLFQGEADLKRFVGFSAENEAYLLLLDAKGEVQWRGHGFFTEQDYAALAAVAKKLAQ